VPKSRADKRRPEDIPESERDYYLERKYPSFGNLVPRDIASRATPRRSATRAAASARAGLGVYLDFRDAIERLGKNVIEERYGNLFEMYERSPATTPTRSRCASTRRSTTRWAACGSTTT
jgi:succinate dehydrogenase / fumarate reductase flavoprotein subunit